MRYNARSEPASTMLSQAWIKMEMVHSCSNSRESTLFCARVRAWAKWNNIEYEIINLASHAPTLSASFRLLKRRVLLGFIFVFGSLALLFLLVTSLAFTASMIHFHFSLRVAANEWQHTHKKLSVIYFSGENSLLHVELARIHRVKYLLLRFVVLCLFAFYFLFLLFLLDFRGSFIWRIQLLVLLVIVNQPPDHYFIHLFRRNDNNPGRLIVFTYLPFFEFF